MEEQHDQKDKYRHQNKYRAKLREQGFNPRHFWVSDEEHLALKARLKEIRNKSK